MYVYLLVNDFFFNLLEFDGVLFDEVLIFLGEFFDLVGFFGFDVLDLFSLILIFFHEIFDAFLLKLDFLGQKGFFFLELGAADQALPLD